MERKWLLTVVFAIGISLASSWACAKQMYCALYHTHSIYSDGVFLNMNDLVNIAKAMGCQVLVITDHSDMLQKNGGYAKEIEEAKKYTQVGRFYVFVSREISVGSYARQLPDEIYDHLNAITYNPDPSDFLFEIATSNNELIKILTILSVERSAPHQTIINYNHPSYGKNGNEWRSVSQRFDCIETLNNSGGNLLETTASKYKYDLNVFLGQWKCTVGGADLHFQPQEDYDGIIRTYFFVDNLDYDSIFNALRRSTIAAKDLKVVSINYPPDDNAYQTNGPVDLELRFKAPIANMILNMQSFSVNIYKDRAKVKSISVHYKFGDPAGEYRVSFSDNIPSGNKSCYVIEVYPSIITSPICFENAIEIQQPLPGKVFRVVKVTPHQMFFSTEKEGLAHPYALGSAFEYCFEDFTLTSDGFIFGCKNPFMIKGVSDYEDGAVLYYAPEVYNNYPIANIEKSFAVSFGKNEYKCVSSPSKFFYCYIINNGKQVSIGDKFYACDPNGPVIYNKDSESINCNKTCLGEASSPGVNNFWSFHKISGDCPVITSGSIWLMPEN